VVSCKDVVKELSNYLDDDLSPGLRKLIEGHLRTCHRCSVVFDSTRKVVLIYSDEKQVLEVPSGYSARLREHFLGAVRKQV
jgi:anti-sigma factor RsiW